MIFWLDLETTGWFEEGAEILEVALVITDDQMREIESHEFVIKQPDSVLDSMNDWCKNAHGKSGLIEASRKSENTLEYVHAVLLDLAREYGSANERPILAGSSIHTDRKFIEKWMPRFDKAIHYRMIDVSTFMEALRRQFSFELPRNANGPIHRAMSDIRQSIEYYKKYLEKFKL